MGTWRKLLGYTFNLGAGIERGAVRTCGLKKKKQSKIQSPSVFLKAKATK
jgi:hypothetical protein